MKTAVITEILRSLRPRSAEGKALAERYAGVLFLNALAILAYAVLFPDRINQDARAAVFLGVAANVILAPLVLKLLLRHNIIKTETRTSGFIALRAAAKLFRLFTDPARQTQEAYLDGGERRALLSTAVKLFFGPLMLSFFFANLAGFSAHAAAIYRLFYASGLAADKAALWLNFYPAAIAGLILIDTFIFGIAYFVEADFLHNRIKSVDETVSGWAFALAAYPPLNAVFDQIFVRSLLDFQVSRPAMPPLFLMISQAVVLLMFTVYVCASIALGLRAGNLVNRGIVTRGPYRWIRHPAYASKNLAWFFEALPGIVNPVQIFQWFFWIFIYCGRAITEERHLMRDPAYQAYCQKVRYRFIPGVF